MILLLLKLDANDDNSVLRLEILYLKLLYHSFQINQGNSNAKDHFYCPHPIYNLSKQFLM
jgi:hypothetical protein